MRARARARIWRGCGSRGVFCDLRLTASLYQSTEFSDPIKGAFSSTKVAAGGLGMGLRCGQGRWAGQVGRGQGGVGTHQSLLGQHARRKQCVANDLAWASHNHMYTGGTTVTLARKRRRSGNQCGHQDDSQSDCILASFSVFCSITEPLPSTVALPACRTAVSIESWLRE